MERRRKEYVSQDEVGERGFRRMRERGRRDERRRREEERSWK